MRQKRTSIPSIAFVLQKISDDKALILLGNIAILDGTNHIPVGKMDLTAKQYYSRISGLMAAGLIKRNRGKYSLSCLGKVVYDVQLTIRRTLQYYWKLKAIESMQNSDISEQDFSKLVNSLIDNYQLKDNFIKSQAILE
jgi:hypothetical protein